MTNIMKSFNHSLKSVGKSYSKMSLWGKVLLFVVLLLIVIVYFKGSSMSSYKIEGFEDSSSFLFKTGPEIYDGFYSEIYDQLVYNQLKDQFEVGEIINKTDPTSESIILDLGCGTGHHVALLEEKGYKAVGVDNSKSMIKQAQKNYPQYNFMVGDATNAALFNGNSFTHIVSLYFTLYYIKDKNRFFENCFYWLKPGGHLVIHLVDRDMFDPIIPPANPLITLTPQRYAASRITKSSVTFTNFKYNANFEINNDLNEAKFIEKFYFNDGKKRKNEHTLYIPTEDSILLEAQYAGFIVQGKVDLLNAAYEYQYLYILEKPN